MATEPNHLQRRAASGGAEFATHGIETPAGNFRILSRQRPLATRVIAAKHTHDAVHRRDTGGQYGHRPMCVEADVVRAVIDVEKCCTRQPVSAAATPPGTAIFDGWVFQVIPGFAIGGVNFLEGKRFRACIVVLLDFRGEFFCEALGVDRCRKPTRAALSGKTTRAPVLS